MSCVFAVDESQLATVLTCFCLPLDEQEPSFVHSPISQDATAGDIPTPSGSVSDTLGVGADTLGADVLDTLGAGADTLGAGPGAILTSKSDTAISSDGSVGNLPVAYKIANVSMINEKNAVPAI